ncbi:hypothetical protein NMC72_07310 [Enterococcus faecium]|uniref:hypothetical protein n=1 Tax=Enterococcus faecium TaxID=1352 RepID=UPI000DA753D2|nr:hypothetical protein [Enterococcus faecium]MBY3641129.1 hypothetical protein [Enterococcus faecium]MCX3905430.1 hypothetical protein [Enterococcus faecium]MCX3933590.1 hypothetical protein [Enterococcus faecium]MCX3974639.1 hypothetical protein [Enterococcus faecium]MCX4003057.1 hypothetical protein [Enterococcus faecium]
MFRKKQPDMLIKNYGHDEIQGHKTLSKKVVSLDLFGPLSDTVHEVELKEDENGVQYLVFTYITGKAVMNWGYGDYVKANEKIDIGSKPIYFYAESRENQPVLISMDYRLKG